MRHPQPLSPSDPQYSPKTEFLKGQILRRRGDEPQRYPHFATTGDMFLAVRAKNRPDASTIGCSPGCSRDTDRASPTINSAFPAPFPDGGTHGRQVFAAFAADGLVDAVSH